MGTFSVPETAVGVRQRVVDSLLLGITRTHEFVAARICSISASGTSFFNLMHKPWLWQRMVPTRTQTPSTGTGGVMPVILLVLAMPFHSSLVLPSGISLSIQGIKLPASRMPHSRIGRGGGHRAAHH